PELVQLWYQMALNGRRDLGYAPSPRSGFEMSLLRMLAFRPGEQQAQAAAPRTASTAPAPSPAARTASRAAAQAAAEQARAALEEPQARPRPAPMPQEPARVAEPRAEEAPPAPARAASTLLVTDTEHWLALVAQSGLRGPAKLLAEHAAFVAHADGVLRLSLVPEHEHLKSPSLVLPLGDAMARLLGGDVQLRFETGQPRGETASARNDRERSNRQSEAERGFADDPAIRRMVDVHGARIVPDSIRPLDG